GPLAANCFDCVLYFPHAVADAPAVGFEFLFARPSRADATAEAGELFAASSEARKQVVKLREFDLQLAFSGARMDREDVENELGAIDDAAANSLLHVAKLHRGQIVIDDYERHVAKLGFQSNLFEFSFADE